MSAQEQQAPDVSGLDPTSSVSITMNAKQQRQWVVKVRAVSNDESDVQRAFDLAVALDRRAEAEYYGQTAQRSAA